MDTVIRGASVIDGTGAARRHADIGISDGRIAAVGDIAKREAAGADVVDLDGLTVAPGFIDSHTHYDAQILWDADLTPSCWHGVTTVVMGNCGFGIAPTHEDHRGKILRTLENVEAMSLSALEAGITWDFETFPEYLDVVAARPKRCNASALVGHTPVRLWVLGEDANQRPATAEEVAAERQLVEEALRAGAVGFASSKTEVHVGESGRPVPSRLASNDEIIDLAGALPAAGHGIMQFTWSPEFGLDDLIELQRKLGAHPITFTALLDQFTQPLEGRTTAEVLDEIDRSGADVWPQVSPRPLVFQLTMMDPFALAQGRTAFQEVVAAPRDQRISLYRDPEWRDRARGQLGPEWAARWARTTVQETTAHQDIRNGPSMAQLAASRGVDPFDVVVDLALADDLETRFKIVMYNFDEDAVASLLRHPHTLISLSDAGAHASQLCDANFATWLLQRWVRELNVLTLEQAIYRLTAHPARLYGLHNRGSVAPGYWADLVAFDPETVGTEDVERVWDLPGGADRLIAHSRGVEAMWVNGIQTRIDGKDILGAHHGVLVRGGNAGS